MSPPWGLLARNNVRVVLAATVPDVDFTKETPQLDFGQEISVESVQVLNASTIAANLFITKNAATGFRDIAIKTKTRLLRGPMSFEVRSPIAVSVVSGVPEQGSRVVFKVTNTDTTPFDADTVRLLLGDGVPYVDATLQPLAAKGPAALTFTALVDPLAPVGPLQIALGNFSLPTPTPDTVFYSDRAVKVGERAPKDLAAGANLTGETIAKAFGTQSYKLSGAAGTLLNVVVTGTGTTAKPCYWLTSRSGKARELLRYAGIYPGSYAPPPSLLLPFDAATGDLYLLVGDTQGRSGAAADIGWTISATSVPAAAIAEQATAHAVGAAQAVAPGAGKEGVVVSGVVGEEAEVDVYEIDFGAAKTSVEVSVTRKNPLGSVVVSTNANFASNNTELTLGDVWNSQAAATGPSSQKWYVKVAGHPDGNLTSYVLAVRGL